MRRPGRVLCLGNAFRYPPKAMIQYYSVEDARPGRGESLVPLRYCAAAESEGRTVGMIVAVPSVEFCQNTALENLGIKPLYSDGADTLLCSHDKPPSPTQGSTRKASLKANRSADISHTVHSVTAWTRGGTYPSSLTHSQHLRCPLRFSESDTCWSLGPASLLCKTTDAAAGRYL
nr:hypothetical protein CFP56_73818 [Quercus suber]